MANKVILIGNLGKDPEVRFTPNGTAVANFSLATTEKFKSNNEVKQETSWHNVVMWGKLAELSRDYLTKGAKVYIEGRIKYEKYTPKEGGGERTITKIIGEKIEFLTKKDSQKEQPNHEEVPLPSDDDVPF